MWLPRFECPDCRKPVCDDGENGFVCGTCGQGFAWRDGLYRFLTPRRAEASAAFHRAKSALITQHTGGEGAISPANGNFNAFAKDYEQLAAEVVELDLHPIKLADLKLPENEAAGNEFPIGLLNALHQLIIDNGELTTLSTVH